MMGESRKSDPGAPRSDCDAVTQAAAGAERMISRMQDIMTQAIQPDGDAAEAFNELVEELDPGPEGEALRRALGLDEDGTRDLPQDEHGHEPPATPDDTPPEYVTWRTGP